MKLNWIMVKLVALLNLSNSGVSILIYLLSHCCLSHRLNYEFWTTVFLMVMVVYWFFFLLVFSFVCMDKTLPLLPQFRCAMWSREACARRAQTKRKLVELKTELILKNDWKMCAILFVHGTRCAETSHYWALYVVSVLFSLVDACHFCIVLSRFRHLLTHSVMLVSFGNRPKSMRHARLHCYYTNIYTCIYGIYERTKQLM